MGGEFILPRAATRGNPLRLAVLISGGGSGLASLLKHQLAERRNHRTVLVLSDRIDSGGLEFGRESDIRTLAIQLPNEPDPEKRRILHEQEINEALVSCDTEMIVLSGYMRILTPWFVGKWKGRIVNIHPSLLPAFPGAHAHRDVLSAGVSTTGCTVHLVDEGVDSGPILAHREVPVMPDDDETSLQERVKRAERLLYPSVIDQLASGEISL
jgi:formyltetrahydrofolate-dependent phosphoribosylglycinamide formyltransferase